jgi:hypothetical protein
MHYTVEDVLATGTSSRYGRVGEVELKVGDTADNPASTKHLINGPVYVRYIEYPDGGIGITVTEVEG